ncbi:hypothetical protein [Turicibacter sp. KK003]|uniref:hypothetical protein n=1 Tax=Turicibacter sp. KK003 TaxID=3114695 RepID=UPI0030D4CA12
MEKWDNQSLEAWVDPHLAVVEEVLRDTTNLTPSGDDSSSEDPNPSSHNPSVS